MRRGVVVVVVVVVVVIFSLVSHPGGYARESVWGVQIPTSSSKLCTIGRRQPEILGLVPATASPIWPCYSGRSGPSRGMLACRRRKPEKNMRKDAQMYMWGLCSWGCSLASAPKDEAGRRNVSPRLRLDTPTSNLNTSPIIIYTSP